MTYLETKREAATLAATSAANDVIFTVRANEYQASVRLAAYREHIRMMESAIRGEVAAARAANESWADIGAALGVSKQAAAARFKGL